MTDNVNTPTTIAEFHNIGDSSLYGYRLDELQRALNSLNTNVVALSTQVMTLQLSLPDRFLTRLEFAEIIRQKEIQQAQVDKHLTSLDTAIYEVQTAQGQIGWKMAGALITALISAATAAFTLLTHTLGK